MGWGGRWGKEGRKGVLWRLPTRRITRISGIASCGGWWGRERGEVRLRACTGLGFLELSSVNQPSGRVVGVHTYATDNTVIWVVLRNFYSL